MSISKKVRGTNSKLSTTKIWGDVIVATLMVTVILRKRFWGRSFCKTQQLYHGDKGMGPLPQFIYKST